VPPPFVSAHVHTYTSPHVHRVFIDQYCWLSTDDRGGRPGSRRDGNGSGRGRGTLPVALPHGHAWYSTRRVTLLCEGVALFLSASLALSLYAFVSVMSTHAFTASDWIHCILDDRNAGSGRAMSMGSGGPAVPFYPSSHVDPFPSSSASAAAASSALLFLSNRTIYVCGVGVFDVSSCALYVWVVWCVCAFEIF
jgi:hypothetical protein